MRDQSSSAQRAPSSDTSESTSFPANAQSLLTPETRESYRARRAGDSSVDLSNPAFFLNDESHSSSIVLQHAAIESPTTAAKPIDVANQMIDQLANSIRGHRQAVPPVPQTPQPTPLPQPHSSTEGLPNHPDYEILRELSRGESAVVYEAYDRSLRRYVAIRQLNEKSRSDPRQSELFWHEARFLAGLVHENVCRVHTVDEQRAWIIMEMMNGSLESRLAEGPLSCDVVRSILRQALQGLRYLHGRDKLHGEIKPSKLLLDDEGSVKLSATTGFSVGGEFRRPRGPQKYVAPELLRPEVFGDAGPGVDLYCLGLTALELLTGDKFSKVFKGVQDGKDDLAWMRWHSSASEQLPPLQDIVPDIPEDLAATLTGLLQKHVEDRYQSAEEALKDLEERPIILMDVPQTEKREEKPRDKGPGVIQIGAPPKMNSPQRNQREKAQNPAGNWQSNLRDPDFFSRLSKDRRVLTAILVMVGVLAATTIFVGKTSKSPGKLAEVSIKTTPPGARLIVNGDPLKVVSPHNMNLAPGSYVIQAERDGFKSAETKIELKRGREPQRVHLELEQLPYEQPKDQIKVAEVLPKEKPKTDKEDEDKKRLEQARRDRERRLRLLAESKAKKPAPKPSDPKPTQNEPVKLRTFASVPHEGIAASFEQYASRFMPEEWQRQEYLAHTEAILNEAWRTKSVRKGIHLADEHYRQARRISDEAPWLYHAYGLLLKKNEQPSDAAVQFQYASQRAQEHRIPLFAPLRESIRDRVNNHEYAVAAAECLQLTEFVGSCVENGEVRDGEAAAAIAMNAHFVGQIMGFLKGPAASTSRTVVNFDVWDGKLKALLPSYQQSLYTDAQEKIQSQFSEQLALKETREREWEEKKKEMRESGQTQRFQTNGRIRIERGTERIRYQRQELFAGKTSGFPTSSLNGQAGGQFNVSNMQNQGTGQTGQQVIGSQGSGPPENRLDIVRRSKRSVDSTKEVERTKFNDPKRPWIREPFVLRTYLAEDFELGRIDLLAHLAPKPTGIDS